MEPKTIVMGILCLFMLAGGIFLHFRKKNK
jgi:LPXTG-motif cell wall-anchored protein